MYRLLFFIAALFSYGAAHAAGAPPKNVTPQVTLTVLDMDPQSPATLHRNDNVYLRIGYSSNVPVYVWVRPYYQGDLAKAGTSGRSRQLPAGQGEQFAWFFMMNPGAVDELRLSASSLNGRSESGVTEQSVPVDFTWSGESAPPDRRRRGWRRCLQGSVSNRSRNTTLT